MWTLFLCAAALGAPVELSVADSAEVTLDGQPLAVFRAPGVWTMDIAPGSHSLGVRSGEATSTLDFEVALGSTTRVRIADGAATLPDAPKGLVLHTSGAERLLVVVGRERVHVAPGDALGIDVAPGQHLLSVRSADGTAVYATGQLEVPEDARIDLWLDEGRLPRVEGGGRFHADRGGRPR